MASAKANRHVQHILSNGPFPTTQELNYFLRFNNMFEEVLVVQRQLMQLLYCYVSIVNVGLEEQLLQCSHTIFYTSLQKCDKVIQSASTCLWGPACTLEAFQSLLTGLCNAAKIGGTKNTT